jgi:secondary thiamine-phosphate synthase enzyme
MESQVLAVETADRLVTDITRSVFSFCDGRGDGLCSVFAGHATAGVALMEVGSGSEEDLADSLARILPKDISYVHSHGSRGHGADHLLPVIVSPSLVLPVLGGEPALGTWQRVVLVDPNRDNPQRLVRLSFVSG